MVPGSHPCGSCTWPQAQLHQHALLQVGSSFSGLGCHESSCCGVHHGRYDLICRPRGKDNHHNRKRYVLSTAGYGTQHTCSCCTTFFQTAFGGVGRCLSWPIRSCTLCTAACASALSACLVLQSCTNLTTFCHEPATFLAMHVRGKNMLFVARSQAAGPFKGVVWWHTNLTLGRDDRPDICKRACCVLWTIGALRLKRA